VLSHAVLNRGDLLKLKVETVVALVKFVGEFKLGAGGRPNPILVVVRWVHAADLFELFPELILRELPIVQLESILVQSSKNLV
jgi:hypothetical protein